MHMIKIEQRINFTLLSKEILRSQPLSTKISKITISLKVFLNDLGFSEILHSHPT